MVRRGFDTKDSFKKYGINMEDLRNPYSFVSLNAYVRLFEFAASRLNSPTLGADIGNGFRPSDLGPRGVLFSLSGSLRRAIQRITEDGDTFQSHSALYFDSDPEMSTLHYAIRDRRLWPRRQDAEYSLASLCQMIRVYFHPDWRPVEIRFEHDDSGQARRLEHLFRSPVVFNAPGNAIVFENTRLDEIVREEDGGLINILERHIADISGNIVHDEIMASVRALIENHIGREKITVSFIAGALGISSRTLQRRLREKNVTLRQCLDEFRREAAARRVESGGEHLSNIGFSLGYSEATAFWRARRRWERNRQDG
nr:AraC family transcriptional regulator [Gluconacetobacter sacchari]